MHMLVYEGSDCTRQPTKLGARHTPFMREYSPRLGGCSQTVNIPAEVLIRPVRRGSDSRVRCPPQLGGNSGQRKIQVAHTPEWRLRLPRKTDFPYGKLATKAFISRSTSASFDRKTK